MSLRVQLAAGLVLIAVPAAATPCAEEAALRTIKTEVWPRLYRTQDAAGLARLLHDDFRVVDGKGAVSTKAEEVDWLAKNKWSVEAFTYDVTTIVCAGDAALIVGTGTTRKGARQSTYVSSNTLVKSPQGWQVLSSHLSGERSGAAK